MLTSPSMLVSAAEKAGIKIPDDLDGDWTIEDFPHWNIFCVTQLDRPCQWGKHWTDAEIIAKLSEDEARNLTIKEARDLGLLS